jgi:[acyl-carrier-protein] S-malonyltransferase
MAELFSQAKKEDRPKMPICPYVPNRTARITQELGLVFELLVDQVDHPVLWKQSVSSLLDAGFTHSIEFGPGKVLSGLVKRISGSSNIKTTQLSVGDSIQVKALGTTLNELSNLTSGSTHT